LGVIKEFGGKMHFSEGEFEKVRMFKLVTQSISIYNYALDHLINTTEDLYAGDLLASSGVCLFSPWRVRTAASTLPSSSSLSPSGATGRGGWKEFDSRANREKIAMKYEVEIRRIVIYFCIYYSFLNYCNVIRINFRKGGVRDSSRLE
jgi:hypothetical protein